MPTKIPIDFQDIAEQSGCRRGRLFYSTTFKSWAVDGDSGVSMCLVKAPKGAIRIEDNMWVCKDPALCERRLR